MRGAMIFGIFMAASSLSSCSGPAEDEAAGAALENAAEERGLIRSAVAEPTGIFERRKGNGRERLCVVPAEGDSLRFAAELRAEGGTSCLTGGELSVSKVKSPLDEPPQQRWKFQFKGLENCVVEAQVQADMLRFPSQFSADCAQLCAGRVDLTGAEMDRTSWAEQEARGLRLQGADRSVWTECGQKNVSGRPLAY